MNVHASTPRKTIYRPVARAHSTLLDCKTLTQVIVAQPTLRSVEFVNIDFWYTNMVDTAKLLKRTPDLVSSEMDPRSARVRQQTV